MITEKDVKKRIAEILRENGFKVYASDTADGFKKPSFCVDVLPSSMSRENGCMILTAMSCNIIYFPEVETTEQLINITEKLREMFFYKPFDVEDRRITVNEIKFQFEDTALSADFELEFYDELECDDADAENFADLDLNLNL